jgi:hypothetical protein
MTVLLDEPIDVLYLSMPPENWPAKISANSAKKKKRYLLLLGRVSTRRGKQIRARKIIHSEKTFEKQVVIHTRWCMVKKKKKN